MPVSIAESFDSPQAESDDRTRARRWEASTEPSNAERLLAALRELHGNAEGTRRFRELFDEARAKSRRGWR